MISVRQIHPVFATEVTGVDLAALTPEQVTTLQDASNDFFIGDYTGIAAGGGSFHPAWSTGGASSFAVGNGILQTATLSATAADTILAAGEWAVPGGRVEAGETLAEAVVRELAEETGLEGVCGPLVGWVERMGANHHYAILDFTVTVLDPTPTRAGDDAAEAAWVPMADVAELPLVEGLAEFLHEHGILPTIA